eukprot:scaffold57086_cov59-Phaeocystis_antarctica.AAC.6
MVVKETSAQVVALRVAHAREAQVQPRDVRLGDEQRKARIFQGGRPELGNRPKQTIAPPFAQRRGAEDARSVVVPIARTVLDDAVSCPLAVLEVKLLPHALAVAACCIFELEIACEEESCLASGGGRVPRRRTKGRVDVG